MEIEALSYFIQECDIRVEGTHVQIVRGEREYGTWNIPGRQMCNELFI
jgi:hypothetical protein